MDEEIRYSDIIAVIIRKIYVEEKGCWSIPPVPDGRIVCQCHVQGLMTVVSMNHESRTCKVELAVSRVCVSHQKNSLLGVHHLGESSVIACTYVFSSSSGLLLFLFLSYQVFFFSFLISHMPEC